VDLEPPRRVLVDEEFDLVFQRTDPPVDADYVTVTQVLSLCRRARVLNRPEGILAANRSSTPSTSPS
jgi:glutathione synthase/RimK-type ligase-like ATP-grasp enzyme